MEKRVLHCFRLVVLSCVLTACAGAPSAVKTRTQELWQNDWFPGAPAVSIPSAESVFELSPAARAKLQELASRHRDPYARMQALMDEVYGFERFAYLANTTAPAKVAWETRSGNCLSLTILATAMARELGLYANVQAVPVPLNWGRDGNVDRLNQHVNVIVSPKKNTRADAYAQASPALMVIDFEPVTFLPSLVGNRSLSDAQVTAYFYNNLAADALAVRDNDRAYALLREAIRQAPDDAAAWANLAVLYRRIEGDAGLLTARVAAHAADLNADGLVAKGVLLAGARARGEFERARRLEDELQALRETDPLTRLRLARNKWADGDRSAAIRLLEKTLAYANGYAAVHQQLSEYYAATGDAERGAVQQKLALASTDVRGRSVVGQSKQLRFESAGKMLR